MGLHRKNALAALLAVFATSWSHAALADSSALAEKLFQDGRKSLAEGRVGEACDLFKKSQDAEPSAGTLLNLAACREKNGQLATAYRAYNDAQAAARVRGRADWEDNAKAHAASLKVRMPRVVIRAPQASLRVSLDGVMVTPKEYGTELPVDPGQHQVDAVRTDVPQKNEGGFVVEFPMKEGDVHHVDVPELDANNVPVLKAGAQPEDDRAGGIRKPLAFALIGTGVASVGVGVLTAILASSKLKDAESKCPALKDPNVPEPIPCDRDAISDNDSARTLGTVSTITLIAGGALAATGVAVLIFAPSKKKADTATLTPFISPTSAGTTFRFTF